MVRGERVVLLSCTPEHVLHTKILQKVIGQPTSVRATLAQAQAVQNLGTQHKPWGSLYHNATDAHSKKWAKPPPPGQKKAPDGE